MSTNEVVLETLTETIQRQERFIAQLQADLEQARQASVDTMLGQLRLREAVLLYVGQDADNFAQQIAENFGKRRCAGGVEQLVRARQRASTDRGT